MNSKILLIVFISLYSNNIIGQILNLGFEYKELFVWQEINNKDYEIDLDSIICYSGYQSVKINNKKDDTLGKFGGLSQTYFLNEEISSIEFSGYLKSKSINNWTGLWLRVNDINGKVLFFDNMHNRLINGTREWRKFTISNDQLPKNSYSISFGVALNGTGTAWFDSLSLIIDKKQLLDLQPKNLTPNINELSWLKKQIIPISSYNPSYPNNNDLKSLESIIKDAKIIGLGEVTHGSSPIFKMKHRLIKHFNECCGFNLFSIEASMPEASKVNDYVINGKGDPYKLISDMKFWTWSTMEVLSLVEWMKKNNSKSNKISFSGFDMQFYGEALNILQKFSTNVGDKNLISEISKLENELYQFKTEKNSDSKLKIKNNINIFLNKIDKSIDPYFSRENYNWLKQNLSVLKQFSNMNNFFDRDKYMAENVKWLLKNNSESKLILWGHNTHIKERSNFMGGYLNKFLGENKYISIGFAFFDGKYTAYDNLENKINEFDSNKPFIGTFEHYFNSIDVPIFAIDLRNIDTGNPNSQWLLKKMGFRSTGAVKMDNEFYLTSIKKDFDVIIFINKSTSSKLFNSK